MSHCHTAYADQVAQLAGLAITPSRWTERVINIIVIAISFAYVSAEQPAPRVGVLDRLGERDE